jgi:hypothetical protein
LLAVHLGVLLLLGGSLLSGLLRTEYRLRLNPGEPAARLEIPGQLELALADAADPQAPAVLVLPLAELIPGRELNAPGLPFVVRVLAFAPHARLVSRGPGREPDLASAPPGRGPGERHHPAVRLVLEGADGESRELVVSTTFVSASGMATWSSSETSTPLSISTNPDNQATSSAMRRGVSKGVAVSNTMPIIWPSASKAPTSLRKVLYSPRCRSSLSLWRKRSR